MPMDYERLYKHIMGVLQDWTSDPTEGFSEVEVRCFRKVLNLMVEKEQDDPRFLVG